MATGLGFLLEELGSPSPATRWRAAEQLGRRRETSAVGRLLALLDDEDWRVRAKAIWALGECGDPAALPRLRRLYADEGESNRDLIRAAMDRLRGKIAEPPGSTPASLPD